MIVVHFKKVERLVEWNLNSAKILLVKQFFFGLHANLHTTYIHSEDQVSSLLSALYSLKSLMWMQPPVMDRDDAHSSTGLGRSSSLANIYECRRWCSSINKGKKIEGLKLVGSGDSRHGCCKETWVPPGRWGWGCLGAHASRAKQVGKNYYSS